MLSGGIRALQNFTPEAYLTKPQIRVRSISCLFCSDPCLNSFMTALPTDATLSALPDDQQASLAVNVSVDYMRNVDRSVAVRFLPVILNFLFSMMARSQNRQVQSCCFSSADLVVQHAHAHVDGGSFRSPIVSAYVEHWLTDEGCDDLGIVLVDMLHLALVSLDEDESDAKRQIVMRNVWFWLDCINKCCMLAHARGQLQIDRLQTALSEMLEKMAIRVLAHKSALGVSALKAANSCIALFLVDLLNVLDSNIVRCAKPSVKFLIVSPIQVFSLTVHYFEAIDVKDSVILDFKVRITLCCIKHSGGKPDCSFQMRFAEIIFDSLKFLNATGIYHQRMAFVSQLTTIICAHLFRPVVYRRTEHSV